MLKTTSILILVLLSFSLQAQNEFGKSFIIGTSLTFIPNYQKNYTSSDYNYYEYTWNLNAAVSLSKRVFIGVQVMTIFTNGSRIENTNYSIVGLFGQFDFTPKKDYRLFLETSINLGNYCTCGDFDPYKKEKLSYWGWGGGVELPLRFLSSKLYLDLSFITYLILNDIENKYAYTQYIVGINYRFGKQI